MSETREPCLCCQTSLCCAGDNGMYIDFDPTPQFDDYYVYVQNSNPKKCIAEAYVTIDIEKEASPQLGCGDYGCYGPGSYCGAVPNDVKGYFFNEVRALVEFASFGDYKLSVYPNIVQVSASGTCRNEPIPVDLQDCEKFSLQCIGRGSNTSCSCNGDIFADEQKKMFQSEKTTGNLGCQSYTDVLGYCYETWWAPTLLSVNEELRASPLSKDALIGGTRCEYYCYGVSTSNVPGISCCYDRHWAGICYVTDKICWHAVDGIYLCCAVKCLPEDDPCPGDGYNWPLTLDCNCSSTYKTLVSTGTTDCKLYFIDSGFYYYDRGKCRQTATYGGAIQANEVICSETPNHKDCKCCS